MSRIRWTSLQLATLSKRVRAYNQAITNAEKAWKKDTVYRNFIKYLPKRITVQEVKARVKTMNDFRRIVGYDSAVSKGRSSELTRILKKYNKDALKVKYTDKGTITTEYQQQKEKLEKRRKKQELKQQREDAGILEAKEKYDAGEISPEEYHSQFNNNDLIPDDEGERDYDIEEEIDAQTKQQWDYEDSQDKSDTGSLTNMYDTYIDAWTDITNMHMGMTGYEQLIVDLNWLYRFAPRRLMKIFNSGYDEADPKFIVPSKNSPYVYIDYEVRHNRAVNFWHAQRVKEENRRNSNNGNKK